MNDDKGFSPEIQFSKTSSATNSNYQFKQLFGQKNNTSPKEQEVSFTKTDVMSLLKPDFQKKWEPPAIVNVKVLTLFDNPYLCDKLYHFVMEYDALFEGTKDQFSEYFVYMDRSVFAVAMSQLSEDEIDEESIMIMLEECLKESRKFWNNYKGKHYCARTLIRSYKHAGIQTYDSEWFEANVTKLIPIVDAIFLRMIDPSTWELFHSYCTSMLHYAVRKDDNGNALNTVISFGEIVSNRVLRVNLLKLLKLRIESGKLTMKLKAKIRGKSSLETEKRKIDDEHDLILRGLGIHIGFHYNGVWNPSKSPRIYIK